MTGLIDFGDLVWSPRVAGLAVARGLRDAGPPRPRARRRPARARLPRGRAAAPGGAGRALRPRAHAAGHERVHRRPPARRRAGERLPADQPDRRSRRRSSAWPARAPTSPTSATATPAATRPCRARGRSASGCCAPPPRPCWTSTWPPRRPSCSTSRSGVPELPDGLSIGRYGEERPIYRGPQYKDPEGRSRTVHLGCDLFLPAGANVRSPFAGVIEERAVRAMPTTTAACCCVRHDGFWTLHGHLDPDSIAHWNAGDPVAAGEVIAQMGAARGQRRLGRRTCTSSCSRTWPAAGRTCRASPTRTSSTSGRASAPTRTCCSAGRTATGRARAAPGPARRRAAR